MSGTQKPDIVVGTKVITYTYGLTTLGVVIKIQNASFKYPYLVHCDDSCLYHLMLSELIPIPENATEDQIKALRNLYGYSSSS